MTMRTVTIIVCVLDAAVWALVAFEMFASGSGPATSGLDEAAGYIMTALFLITHNLPLRSLYPVGASSQMRGCALVAQRRRCLICRGPRRPPGDQGDRRAQEDQNGAEDDKARARTPVVGDGAHCRRDRDRRQSVHGLAQPDHRTLTVGTDGFRLHREHDRLDDPLQPAASPSIAPSDHQGRESSSEPGIKH